MLNAWWRRINGDICAKQRKTNTRLAYNATVCDSPESLLDIVECTGTTVYAYEADVEHVCQLKSCGGGVQASNDLSHVPEY